MQKQKACKKALRLRSTYGKAFYNLGIICYEIDKKTESYECFKSCCTKADFDNETGFNAYGNISAELKKYDEAIFAYQKSLELNPTSQAALAQLTSIYKELGKNEQAVIFCQRLAILRSTDYKTSYMCADLFMKLKRPSDALGWFEKASKCPGCPPAIYLEVANCFANMGHLDKSAEILTKIVDSGLADDLKGMAKMALEKIKQVRIA